ncbi:MAG: MurR/RpiR family transcriptional regulator [Deltaproteobacteria bacterium]|nr:MurR/RpiR family transcriptional regulator [Deltaproteobacteria bacterium]
MKEISHLPGSFSDRVERSYLTLRRSEKKIADHLKRSPPQRLDLSITDFARLLDVSEATVSRFCRTLGYRGFQDLKLSLAADLAAVEGFQNIPVDILETDSPAVVGKKLSDTLSSAIVETQRSLEMDKVDAAVEEIVRARRVEFYGVGGAFAVASEANHLFLKAGINCTAFRDGYMQTVTASMLEGNCVAIGISHTGLSMDVVNAMKIASDNGAVTIGITSNRESPLARVSRIPLFTPPRQRDIPLYGDFMEARVSQLYIIDLLYLGIIFRKGEVSKKSLKKSAHALETYYNPIR